jgi:hypothetical protein
MIKDAIRKIKLCNLKIKIKAKCLKTAMKMYSESDIK